MKNSIVAKTVEFNKAGNVPVGFSVSNMENAFGIFAEEVGELTEWCGLIKSLSDSRECAARHTSEVATEIVDGCVDTIVTAIGILYRMGMTAEEIDEAFEVVVNSNLSKFPTTLAEAEDSVRKYEDDPRYKNVGYKVQDRQYVVFGAKTDGTADYKILKGVGFVDPEQELRKLVGNIYVERN